MIEIRIDGMIFAMEYTTNQDTRCDECKAGDFCRSGNRVGHWCGKTEYDNMLVCTSATLITDTEETKIYGSHNRVYARYLLNRVVEGFAKGEWHKDKLFDIMGYNEEMAFKLGSGLCSTIREIPTIKKTWSQIQAEHPELAGIELIEEGHADKHPEIQPHMCE